MAIIIMQVCSNNFGGIIMKSKKTEVERKQLPIISLLLGLAVVATTAAYVLYKFASDRAYKKKWQDYDECGLA